MKKFSKYITSIFFIAFALLFLLSPQITYAEENEETICNGVFIDTVDVSGMTVKEAQQALDNHIDKLRNTSFAILAGDKSIIITMDQLDYKYEANNHIKSAISLGKSGNLIRRYKDNKDIEHGKKVYPLTYIYNETKLRRVIEEEAKKIEIQPVNASYSREKGVFVYTDHKLGSRIDIESTIVEVKENLDNWIRMGFVVNANVLDVEPEFTKAKLEKPKSVLGEFSTRYTSSSEDRAANLANGARLINNALLYPGEIFSSYDYLLPFSVDNGYYVAGSYNAGRIEQSIGGGACQVTSTLYNAILFSELDVVERSAHSMTVSYVDLAFDSAIAEGSKNFRFKNNTDMPILIEAFSEDRKISFKVWGYETRNTNRKIEFVNNIVKEYSPSSKEKITEDPTKSASYKKVTQKAKKGYDAELYKVIYVDGVEVDRVLINKSYYHAEPAHVTVGTKK